MDAQKPAEPAPEDYAARDYPIYLGKFYEEVEELSNRQLKKVICAIMEYPFQKRSFRWSYEKEKKAFILGTQIMDCRFVLMKAVLEMKKDEIQKILEETRESPPETKIVDEKGENV